MSHSPSTQPLSEDPPSLTDQGDADDKFGYIIVNDCWHEIPIGESKIGRDASCSIVVNDETVSKMHAVIESEGGEDTFIYDAGSTNKTRMGKMTLRPHCRYKINDGDVLRLGNIDVKFRVMDYKIKNCNSTTFQQLGSTGKDIMLPQERNLDLPVVGGTSAIVDKNNAADKTDIFKNPSIVMKEKMTHANKYYYASACESSPAIDIFSQATQCEFTGSKRDCSVTSDIDQKHGIDDDIYNLSTQFEYAGDILKPKDDNSPQLSFLKDCTSTKSKEILRCDFNDSGTFDFVKGKETRDFIMPFTHASQNDDIFELATQCQTISSDSINKDELNFKNVLNKPKNFAENLNMKLKKNSDNQERKLSLTKDNEEINLRSLKDGNEEVMRISSTGINKSNKSPIIFTKQNEFSDEIFMAATQVPEVIDKNDKFTKESILNKNFTKHKNMDKGEKSSTTVGGPQCKEEEQDLVVNIASHLKKSEEVPCKNTSQKAPHPDEDMILTQIFRFSQHLPKENSGNQTNSEIKISGSKDDEFVAKTFVRGDDSEDAKATQLFNEGNLVGLREIQNNGNIVKHSQDEIPTQLFVSNIKEQQTQKNNRDANDKQVLPVTVPSLPNPVPELILSDSGDETESDLEIKLGLDSSPGKEEKKILSIKQEPESSSSRKQLPSHTPKRSPSADSDETVSDLDVVELQENSSAIPNIEDFISTQIFPSSTSKSKTNLSEQFPSSEGTRKRRACEDFIPTQVFPMTERRRSQTANREKSESSKTINTRPNTDYNTIQDSSEDDIIIEEDSNESESLIRGIEEFCSSNQVPEAEKEYKQPSPQHKEPERESSLTLSPSHPAYEALSEIDELIANNGKTSDKSDSGIGAENFYEKDVVNKKELEKKVESDSDETDCEEELKKLQVKEASTEPKLGISDNKSLITSSEESEQSASTSNSTSHLEAEKFGKRSTTGNICQTKETKSGPSFMLGVGIDSPLKRMLVTNSDEGVEKKRVKSVQKRRKKSFESNQLEELVLTQSLKLRNRVIRQRNATPDGGSVKKKAVTEIKTSRRWKGSDMGSSAETVSRVRNPKEKTSAKKKLTEKFERMHEEGSLKSKKDTGDELREMNFAVTKIAFTGFESDCHDKIIKNLGGEKVNHLDDVHVLVSDRVRRTVKFMSAVALGLPIVSPKWLTASSKELRFLNPWDYLLEDKASEEKWGFSLRASLEKWRKQKLLNGYTVLATESTRPPVHEILSIVKCCGGVPITSCPKIWPEKSIVLTSEEDKKWWPSCKWRNVKIVHYEFLLSGVLRHFMDFKSYKLR